MVAVLAVSFLGVGNMFSKQEEEKEVIVVEKLDTVELRKKCYEEKGIWLERGGGYDFGIDYTEECTKFGGLCSKPDDVPTGTTKIGMCGAIMECRIPRLKLKGTPWEEHEAMCICPYFKEWDFTTNKCAFPEEAPSVEAGKNIIDSIREWFEGLI